MISSVVFHELADQELIEATQYYEAESSGLGGTFLKEIEHAIKEIQSNPKSSPVVLKVVRRKLLRRFPYSIMYSIVNNTVNILAIANQKRRPFYWRSR